MPTCPRCKSPADELVPLMVARLGQPPETTWSCVPCNRAQAAEVMGQPAPSAPPTRFLRGAFERTWRGRKLRLEGRRRYAAYDADPGPATLEAVLEWQARQRAAFHAYARAEQERDA